MGFGAGDHRIAPPFNWALGFYSRASPIVRSRTIGGVDNTASLEDTKHTGKRFVICIASRHHIGVQRELLACLHTSGVDVLEAHVYGVDHPSTDEVDAFVASYIVISRGRKRTSTTRNWRK